MSERPRPAMFERAIVLAEPEIGAAGYTLAVERYDHASFGSAFLEYRRRGSALRLVWDGQDSLLRADVRSDSNDWTTVVEVNARAGESEAARTVEGFLAALGAWLRGRPAMR